MTKYKFALFIIIFAALALAFGLWSQHNLHRKQQNNHPTYALLNGTVFPQPRPISAFELVSDKNKAFTNKDLQEQWSLLFFGFTNCGSICPTTMSMLNNTYQKLVADKQEPLPKIIMISVDPHRDTPQRMASYVTGFNKAFLGATGKEEQIKKLTQEMGVLYMQVSKKDSEHYDIDHSGTLMLVNPQGQLAAIFSPPQQPDQLAQDIKTMINYSK